MKKVVIERKDFEARQWRQIPGFDAQILASDDGVIIDAFEHRIFQQITTNAGYAMVHLDYAMHSVARLVCTAWHGEPAPNEEVDHINGDRLDNRKSNLRWVTHRENLANRHITRYRRRKIRCIETGEIYKSAMAAGKAVGVTGGMIAMAVDGMAKSAGGYHWEEA